jgi:hypothetical protein
MYLKGNLARLENRKELWEAFSIYGDWYPYLNKELSFIRNFQTSSYYSPESKPSYCKCSMRALKEGSCIVIEEDEFRELTVRY